MGTCCNGCWPVTCSALASTWNWQRVGVATWIGTQSLMHVAVCGWLVPATGVPMPLVSYGGSATLATVLALALCANIGARREPILAADGFS